ncbi:MAG: hypothetical protein ACE5IF_06325 [Candidatus Bathyarchaeia archaeon]
MPKKYYWTREAEAKLLAMWKSGITDFDVLAKELDRKPLGVKRKLQRMGVVVGKRKIKKTTTTVPLSKNLLTHEEALKILAGALEALRKPDQDKLELQRLRILVDAVHVYDSVLEKFERWAEIESRFLEMAKKIEELEKAQKVSSK